MLGLSLLTKRKAKVKPFRYQPMYYDEAAEKRKEREARIRAELGLNDDQERLFDGQAKARLRGAFQSGRKNHSEGKSLNLTFAIIVLILCFTIYAYAYIGNYSLIALVGIYVLYRVKKHQMSDTGRDGQKGGGQ